MTYYLEIENKITTFAAKVNETLYIDKYISEKMRMKIFDIYW